MILLGVSIGILGSTGIVTFWYADGLSYFSTDPRACVNCHIMQSQYNSWQKASHHTVATCVDCHLPHGFIEKYLAKGKNGYFHSKGFTLQDFHEPIRITSGNLEVLQDNCIDCHSGIVHGLMYTEYNEEISCVHCHRNVGHGEIVGLGGPFQETNLEKERINK